MIKREKNYSLYVQGDAFLNAKETEGVGRDKNSFYGMSSID